MMKSLSPCVVFFMLALAGLDTVTREKVISVATMTLGMSVACATEETFTILGLALMIIERGGGDADGTLSALHGQSRIWIVRGFILYVSGKLFLFCPIGVAVFEQREITLRGDLRIVRENPMPFIAVSVLGFIVMVTTLGVIKTCGSLTFKAADKLGTSPSSC